MRTEIRRLIDEEMACGHVKTFAERLERALIDRIDAYCETFHNASLPLDDTWARRAIKGIQAGIIGGDPKAIAEQTPKDIA